MNGMAAAAVMNSSTLSLDPKKEVEAAILQVHHGFRTHEQVARELGGGDWEENVEQLKRENEMPKRLPRKKRRRLPRAPPSTPTRAYGTTPEQPRPLPQPRE